MVLFHPSILKQPAKKLGASDDAWGYTNNGNAHNVRGTNFCFPVTQTGVQKSRETCLKMEMDAKVDNDLYSGTRVLIGLEGSLPQLKTRINFEH